MRLTPVTWDWGTDTEHGRTAFSSDAPVMVWLATVPADPALHRQLRECLSSEEQTRLARFRKTEDRQRYLAGRVLLRRLLGAYLNQPASDLTIRTGPHGKPFVELPSGHPPAHFNVSHSEDFVLVALSATHEVGVDIEFQRPDRDLGAIASRIFPANDCNNWLRLPPQEQTAGFYRAWTRHEARLKALGHGFAHDPDPSTLAALKVFELDLPENYAGAVALRPS